jgi:hypothetical protein
MHLAAESIPVAEKQGARNASIALKMSLYISSITSYHRLVDFIEQSHF